MNDSALNQPADLTALNKSDDASATEQVSFTPGVPNESSLILAHSTASAAYFVPFAAAAVHAVSKNATCGPMDFPGKKKAMIVFNQPMLKASNLESLTRTQLKVADIGVSICPADAINTDLLSVEGAEILAKRVLKKYAKAVAEVPDVLVINVTAPTVLNNDQAVVLAGLANATKKLSCCVVLYVSGCPDIAQLQRLIQPDDTVHVAPCLPDADDLFAIKMRADHFGNLWLKKQQEYMVSLPKNETAGWKTELFLSDDPITRTMARMRAKKMTMDEIAKKMDVNKSTVSRRLEKLTVLWQD